MQQSGFSNNQRKLRRVTLNFPIEISLGSQITLQGQLKDLSLKSAFVKIKSGIYINPHDEIAFVIKYSLESPEEDVRGLARIARIEAGEGMAIYFTQMDDVSLERLKELLNNIDSPHIKIKK